MLWWRKRKDEDGGVYGVFFFVVTLVIVYPTARITGAVYQFSLPNGSIKVLWNKWIDYPG